MSLPGFTVFYLPKELAHPVKTLDDIPEEAARGFSTVEDWHRALAPMLPQGTRWIGPRKAQWTDRESVLTAEIDGDLHNVTIEAPRVWEGEVLQTFRRLRDAGTWIIVSHQTGELFDFDRPEVN